MTIETLKEFLLWCTVINYAFVLIWFAVFVFAHGWLYRLHGGWFKLSAQQFDAIHYGGLAVYKVGILLLNLVPLVGLYIMT